MDITAALLQAQSFNRKMIFKLANEEENRTKLWRFTASAYGLVESGRLCYLASNTALTTVFGLTRSRYEATLYYKQSPG